MARILTIEDDETTANEIRTELASHQIHVDWIADGRLGLLEAMSGSYDAITLDRMLPGLDGLAIVSALRAAGIETPVLMISALSDVDERVRGLRAGGDDYLTKPFASDEMLARIEALLRRKQTPADPILRVEDIELELLTRIARRQGKDLHLSPTEFKLLECLIRNSNQVVTRTMLFEAVWGYFFDPGTNLIDVHVARLRKKVDSPGQTPLLHTVRGSGYVLGQAS
ncbi:MAG: response regulator transcription factor [Gammaproteobacteria bacterium]|nr:response regulator transcription factor [Gammaproteobacteria bacterium]